MPLFIHHLATAIKSTFRSFKKNWFYGSMNIFGLSIAFTTILLVSTYLFQETSYESFHTKAERIYRPTYHLSTSSGFESNFARIPVNFINELPHAFPEVEHLIRFQNKEQKYIRIGEERFKPNHAYTTDNEVFQVFDFPLVFGDTAMALSNPNSIVLTEAFAKLYFNKTDVIGEEVIITGDWSAEEETYKVTGVMKDLSSNTHLPVDMLFSFNNEEERSGWAYVYTLLRDDASFASLEAKMPDFINEYTNDDDGNTIQFEFQALKDIHLNSNLAREIIPNGQALYIKIFFWVGLLVWIIALVNFTNLSTALAMNRGKEMGVRQVLGASKKSLLIRSFSETLINSAVALVIGAGLAFILFPFFSQLTGVSVLPSWKYLVFGALSMAVLSGLLAGILPAFLMTSVKLLQVMKQGNNWSMKSSRGSINIKRLMISVQFCAAIILMISAAIAYTQFQFINNKNLGIEKEQVLAIPEVPSNVVEQYKVFKQRLSQISGVNQVAACMQLPSSEIRDVGAVGVRGREEEDGNQPMMDMQIIDPDFIRLMNIEFLAGEDYSSKVELKDPPEFDEEFTTQQYLAEAPRQYLINETAMKQLGWQNPTDAIGQEINWSIGPFELAYGSIAGVIKDYHQETLKNTIDPLLLTVEPVWLGNFLIKVQTAELETTIREIKGIWNELFPYALEYHFLDEMFDRLYQQDRVQLQLLAALTLVAILISFIGLVSLVAFALKRRSKELAIRRVVGANLGALTRLIGIEYFWILIIAATIAIPISYQWVSKWLENFAYRITISPWVYFLAIVFLCALLFFTIYLQTLKATVNNPIQALRED